jgi:serine phosphatase RsbU (regulator of sigma subunit)
VYETLGFVYVDRRARIQSLQQQQQEMLCQSILMDDIEQAIETMVERMKKSRNVASMNIANSMERASKNRIKTAKAYLDFFQNGIWSMVCRPCFWI